MTGMRLLAVLLAMTMLGACTTLKQPVFTDDAGALRGYDPVAYFRVGEAVRGDPAFSLEHDGASWSFSSQENLEAFRDDPARFVPQYGGFCAYAMSRGFVVSSDPEAWTVVDDRLYLNYSKSVRNTWLKDVPGYVASADANWAGLQAGSGPR